MMHAARLSMSADEPDSRARRSASVVDMRSSANTTGQSTRARSRPANDDAWCARLAGHEKRLAHHHHLRGVLGQQGVERGRAVRPVDVMDHGEGSRDGAGGIGHGHPGARAPEVEREGLHPAADLSTPIAWAMASGMREGSLPPARAMPGLPPPPPPTTGATSRMRSAADMPA